MESWAVEKDKQWHNYFREVPQLAIYRIRGGKILFLLVFIVSESGQNLWANFNEEQINLIKDIADYFLENYIFENPRRSKISTRHCGGASTYESHATN